MHSPATSGTPPPVAQGGIAREHIDELVLQAVMVLERRDGPGASQGRQVDPEIGKAEMIPSLRRVRCLTREAKGSG